MGGPSLDLWDDIRFSVTDQPSAMLEETGDRIQNSGVVGWPESLDLGDKLRFYVLDDWSEIIMD